jgi:hypothetical protein
MNFCPFALLCAASIANAQPALDAGTALDAETAATTTPVPPIGVKRSPSESPSPPAPSPRAAGRGAVSGRTPHPSLLPASRDEGVADFSGRPRLTPMPVAPPLLPPTPLLPPVADAPHPVPHPTVTLTLADPSPVIGITGETELRIEVSDAPETPMPIPRVLCSVGQVEDLGREGPTKFTGRYILPAGRFPQPAIIVAEFTNFAWPIRGMTTVRLRAAATPSFRTDPGAQVTLRVGDRDFGPQIAPADGVVHVPVVVSPGVEFATARSVNQYGKASEQILDLHVPYSQRVLFVAPDVFVAGAVAEVAVYAVEPSGRPANGSNLVLRATDAKVHPLGSRLPGEALFLVKAPTILKEKNLRMEAQLKDQSKTRVATRITLVPAPAAGLTLEPEAAHLARTPEASLRVFLGAEDAFGNPVDAGRADVLVDGKAAHVKASVEGAPMVIVTTPDPAAGRDEVIVEGVLDSGHAMRRIPIGIGQRLPPPQSPVAPPSPRYTLTPRLGLLWNLGAAAGGALFVDAVAFRSARYPDLGLGLSLGLVQTWFAAESAGGITRTSLTTLPILFQIHQRFLVGRTFFGMGAGAGFAMSWAHIESYGTTVVGSSYGAVAEARLETGFRIGHAAHLVFSLRYLTLYLATFSSGDRINGNAAGAVADLGYRLGF